MLTVNNSGICNSTGTFHCSQIHIIFTRIGKFFIFTMKVFSISQSAQWPCPKLLSFEMLLLLYSFYVKQSPIITFFDIFCNLFFFHFVTYKTKWTGGASALHWMPEREPPLFHSKEVLLSFSHPCLLFCSYFYRSFPTLYELVFKKSVFQLVFVFWGRASTFKWKTNMFIPIPGLGYSPPDMTREKASVNFPFKYWWTWKKYINKAWDEWMQQDYPTFAKSTQQMYGSLVAFFHPMPCFCAFSGQCLLEM